MILFILDQNPRTRSSYDSLIPNLITIKSECFYKKGFHGEIIRIFKKIPSNFYRVFIGSLSYFWTNFTRIYLPLRTHPSKSPRSHSGIRYASSLRFVIYPPFAPGKDQDCFRGRVSSARHGRRRGRMSLESFRPWASRFRDGFYSYPEQGARKETRILRSQVGGSPWTYPDQSQKSLFWISWRNIWEELFPSRPPMLLFAFSWQSSEFLRRLQQWK